MRFDELTTAGVNLAIEEAVVNVMNYAYPAGIRSNILLEVVAEGDEVTFILRDNGVPFDPTTAPEVDVSLPAEERSVGGLGIHLMRHYMDAISYERVDNQNVLTMKKKLNNTFKAI
jgi:sigma-B regulation protein RsbU (phosphoserine phosphatase)